MTTRRIFGLLVAALLLGHGTVYAQRPLGIKIGPGWRLYPELEMRGIYDTNFFFVTDDRISSFGLLVRPGVSAIRDGRRSKLEFGLSGELGRFDTSSDDNYLDSTGFAEFDYVLTRRQNVDVRIERDNGHDPFGLRRTELPDDASPLDIDRDLDEYHTDRIQAGYSFGNPKAPINLDYDFQYRTREYDTNRDLGTRFLDYSRTSHQGTLTYKYSPKTGLLLRTQFREFDYDNTRPDQIPRDFQQMRYLAGVSWRPSGKLTLQALGGVLDHDPDEARRDEFTEPDWDVQAIWEVSDRTTLTLNTGREVRPSFLLAADVINIEQYTLGWKQKWTSRLYSRAQYLDASRSFEGVARKGDLTRADIEVTWLWAREFAIVGSVTRFELSSNTFGRDFQKELLTLGFRYQP